MQRLKKRIPGNYIILFFLTFSLCFLQAPPTFAKSSNSHKTKIAHKSSSKKEAKKTAAKSTKSLASSKKGKSQVKKQIHSKRSASVNAEKELWEKRSSNSEILTGKASWYGKDFHNKATASGLHYDMYTFTAAHRTLPIGTIVKVTDQKNGKSVMVCVTDRGPFVRDRIIDVSYAAAMKLDLGKRGVGRVALEVVGDENGLPLKKGEAYFVKYSAQHGSKTVGPFHVFADAAAMREALGTAHPEAEVVMGKDK